MPSDPARHAIYQVQLDRYRAQQEHKQEPAAAAQTNPEQMTDEQKRARHAERQAAELRAERLSGMAPEQRYQELLRLDDQDRRVLLQLPLPDRQRLLGDLSPEQRETVLALVNPQLVVIGELEDAKLLRAIYSERQLEEVMTDFWFNHFNVFIGKGPDHYLTTCYERDVIRPHALGKFKDLLLATARSPAMLFYLDNWQSVGPNSPVAQGILPRASQRPLRPARQSQAPPAKPRREGLNENYARELMELHTLGVDGGYTQHDVTEVARVFTGWTLAGPRKGGGFLFDERRHEPGAKYVLGKKITEHGEDEGVEVLDLLAHHPSTAHFISRKLAQRFVSDNPPPALVERMAKTFRDSDGDIREVLRTMFHSPEFWSRAAYRAKMKTPLEFVVSAARASGVALQNAMPLAQTLNRMGMPLYAAQPPTGYSMLAETWVSSAALLDRMNFALALATGRLPGLTIDPAQLLTSYQIGKHQKLTAGRAAVDEDSVLPQLETALLGGEVSKQTHDTIRRELSAPQAITFAMRGKPVGITAGAGGGGTPEQAANIGVIAGLILGSPEFQRR
jgi:uncharacterized protein (DUF1800 family)